MIPVVSRRHHVCIIVDALDESGEGNACQLISQFSKVLDAAQEAGGVLKICFSCRHYPILTLDSGITITMEHHNRTDIENIVRERLQGFKEEDKRVLEDEILLKAEGVF